MSPANRVRLIVGLLAVLAAGAVFVMTGAQAQDKQPIKIGFGMALTGPLAPNGKQALLGMQIWEEETNAKGGLLGRPVKLVYYDDKSSPSEIPGIYTKLLDVDKVDLLIAPYGTVPTAPLMPPSALPPRGTDLAQWEKSMIEQALREANGNQTQAAQRLGVSRDTLRYRLKKFGIQ